METKKLYRSRYTPVIGGVCGGLGKYFGIDPIAWRLIFIFGTMFTFFPFIVTYIILWCVVPKEELT